MLFTTIASLQLFQALGTRSRTESLLAIGLGSNRLLLGIAGVVAALQLVALFTPLRMFLGLGRLGAIDVSISIAIGASLLVVLEASKAIARSRLARG